MENLRLAVRVGWPPGPAGEWGWSFTYDGFGNMLSTVVTKGAAPSFYLYPDPATNRLGSSYQWDANGNLTARTGVPTLTLSYDVENRMVEAVHSLNGRERYVYDPANLRVWKQEPSRTLVYFYGIEGNLLATYGDQSNTDYNVYFGGKLIWAEASPGLAAGPVGTDRLGSVVWRNGTANRYFPYGQEAAATGQDRTKFATYYRDETTSFDYARNRYYSTFIARFTTPDPYRASGGPADPQSWNRYSYTRGDPVNRADPSGLLDCPPISGAPVSVLRGPGTLISLAPGLDRQTTMGRQTTTPASRSPPCGGGSIPGTTRMRRTSTSSAPRTGRVVAAGARALGN